MLYTFNNKSFKHHIHPSLQRRLRMFVVISAIMFAVMIFDIYRHELSLEWACISVVVGSAVGYITSRIFHLSWDRDGQHVVGQIDALGWTVLGLYVVFEIGRNTLFETLWHTDSTASAITFAFVSSALISRALGLRGKILRILKEEQVFGMGKK